MSELTKALIQFHKDVDKIDKNARGNYGKFADLSNVLSTITPALYKNGLVLVFTFLEDSLVGTLRHVSGEEISSVAKLVVCEGRNKTQEWGKSVTFQRRYLSVCLTGLVADMDMDGETKETYKPVESTKPDLAKPAPKKTVTKKAAPTPTPAPSADPNDQPLQSEERQAVLALLKEVFASEDGKQRIESLTTKFRKEFKNMADLPLSQAITTQAHVAFINEQL